MRPSLREARKRAGLSQVELARRAGVSRQLVGAVEAGRHLPRVDAALALAAVLHVDVGSLFAPSPAPVDILSGLPPAEGSLVRIGSVGDRLVTAAAGIGSAGWDVADGWMRSGHVEPLVEREPGLVVAGCEPGLEVLERLLREAGMGAVSAAASSAAAQTALGDGRVHAAVVHRPAATDTAAPPGVVRFGLASWRVGLAGPTDSGPGWWEMALRGDVPVVQREAGAGVQQTFEEFVTAPELPVAGPTVATHLEAVRRGLLTGMPAVTIEPAALALGASFHALDTHVAEMWIDSTWLGERVVTAALDTIRGRRFQRRLLAVGGYDLARCGVAIT